MNAQKHVWWGIEIIEKGKAMRIFDFAGHSSPDEAKSSIAEKRGAKVIRQEVTRLARQFPKNE